MGFRFKKSINLGNGVRMNIGKKGIGFSAGVKGARISYGADGKVRTTSSIPGTGISYTSTLNKNKAKKGVNNSGNDIDANVYRVNNGITNHKPLYIFHRFCVIVLILLGALLTLVEPIGLSFIAFGIISWVLGGFYKNKARKDKDENERT